MWRQPGVKLLVLGPSSSETDGGFASREKGAEEGGGGFYLLRLTGRLSLFLRRHVLR